jgi:hypothetical protein
MLTALLGKMKVVGLAGVAVGAMAMAPSAAKADGHFRIGINFRLPEPACEVRPVYAAPVYAAPAYCPPPVCETPVYRPACETPVYRPVVVPVYRPVPVYCPTPVYYRPYAYGGYYRPYCR